MIFDKLKYSYRIFLQPTEKILLRSTKISFERCHHTIWKISKLFIKTRPNIQKNISSCLLLLCYFSSRALVLQEMKYFELIFSILVRRKKKKKNSKGSKESRKSKKQTKFFVIYFFFVLKNTGIFFNDSNSNHKEIFRSWKVSDLLFQVCFLFRLQIIWYILNFVEKFFTYLPITHYIFIYLFFFLRKKLFKLFTNKWKSNPNFKILYKIF